MVPLGKDRPALGRMVFAVLTIVVIAVGGAIGIYFPRGGQSGQTTSTTFHPSSSTSSSSSPSSTTSTSSSSSSSITTTASHTPSPPLFNFLLNSAPQTIVLNTGGNLNYSTILVIPQPNNLQGAAPGNLGIGSELVAFNVTAPSGLTVRFFGSNLTSGYYKEVDAGSLDSLPIELVASQSIAPGDYTIMVKAASGSYAANYSMTVRVVQYLVIANLFAFNPRTLTVKAGSTVYWLNLDTRPEGQYNMVFDTINLRSPFILPGPTYESWGHTFDTPGTYTYHCECTVQGVVGTIVVTS